MNQASLQACVPQVIVSKEPVYILEERATGPRHKVLQEQPIAPQKKMESAVFEEA
jgi:hypothetical protein